MILALLGVAGQVPWDRDCSSRQPTKTGTAASYAPSASALPSRQVPLVAGPSRSCSKKWGSRLGPPSSELLGAGCALEGTSAPRARPWMPRIALEGIEVIQITLEGNEATRCRTILRRSHVCACSAHQGLLVQMGIERLSSIR